MVLFYDGSKKETWKGDMDGELDCDKKDIKKAIDELFSGDVFQERKMDSKKLYEQLKALWEEFEENHEKFTEKGNKAAGGRARKSIGEIKKLVTEYRKASVAESK